jgi:hypothetical protein
MKKILPLMLSLLVLPCLLKAEETIFLVDGIEATATLADESDSEDASFQRSGRYSVRKTTDGDPATCWAVGNGGIGEKIYILVKPGAKAIKIINGLAKSRNLFQANNRVKSLEVTAYAGFTSDRHVTEIGQNYIVFIFAPSAKIILQDTMSEQSLRFPFKWSELSRHGSAVEKEAVRWAEIQEAAERERGQDVPGSLKQSIRIAYILRLEIKELYRGSKYNDTCISELSVR